MSRVGRSRRQLAALALGAIAFGGLSIASSMTAAFGVADGTSFMPCLTGTHGATVRYSFIALPEGPRISAVTIGNLTAAGCKGSPVSLVLKGNPAGDPSAPVTETLTSLDSKVGPCTQTSPAVPVVVAADGEIRLNACSSGGPARYANLHDVTQIDIKARGRAITGVLGEKRHRSGHQGAINGSPLGELPFTGSWAAATFWAGLLLVLSGAYFLALAHRRRWTPAPL